MRFGHTSLAWREQVARNFKKSPAQPRSMGGRPMTMHNSLGRYDELARQSGATRHRLPKDRALAILEEINEAERMVWTRESEDQSMHGHSSDHDGTRACLDLA